MAKRLNQALGVDIGTHSMKIAAVRMADTPVVSALGVSPTPPNTCDHTGIFDPKTLGAALRALVGETGVGVKDAIFCINGQSSVVVRNLEVPKMSDAELREHMGWEIQRNIPFAESTVVSDYRPIPNPNLDATQNMEVVMAVSPQSAVEAVVELVRGAGLKPAAIDVEPLGLGRVILSCHQSDLATKNVCLVHVGHSVTSINMYRQGILAFPRTVPLGSAFWTKAISENLGVGADEAENMKLNAVIPDTAGGVGATVQAYNPFAPSASEPDEQTQAPAPAPAPDTGDSRVYQAMVPQLEEFVAEIRRSIDYYQSRGGQVDELVVSGGGSLLKGLDSFLGRSLGLPVSRLNPLQGIGVEAPGAETLAGGLASQYATAIGMGLYIAYD
ncbi:MAG: type IV pilus assembly protein PilM [Armatimonadetes bacterium]|nr:MAG: type IV pilus assembly protein PilM [Armatimonadota bacterium]